MLDAFRTILVTGYGGFLAHHLGELLAQLADNGRHNLILVTRRQHDLTVYRQVFDLLHFGKPDLVFHLAARCGGIGLNRAHPAELLRDNLRMGLNVLEAAAHVKRPPKVVVVGSVCMYPKFCPVPFREEAIFDGFPEETNAPYGEAKRALLVAAQAYRREFGLNAVTVVPTNLYGERDRFDPVEEAHVIPALIRKFDAALRERAPVVRLWGTGTATREFLYAGDAARGLVAAAERLEDGEPVNLGSGQEVSIADLAAVLRELYAGLGVDAFPAVEWDTSQPDGQPRRRVDTARAKAKLGWEAEVDLCTGLERTVAWWHEQGEEAGS